MVTGTCTLSQLTNVVGYVGSPSRSSICMWSSKLSPSNTWKATSVPAASSAADSLADVALPVDGLEGAEKRLRPGAWACPGLSVISANAL
ncbi:hypothetical protein N7501_011279 [Penicillium viridicatum]|nr:hypothetical protein N7501_011279 [Penicillium viridicatum]